MFNLEQVCPSPNLYSRRALRYIPPPQCRGRM